MKRSKVEIKEITKTIGNTQDLDLTDASSESLSGGSLDQREVNIENKIQIQSNKSNTETNIPLINENTSLSTENELRLNDLFDDVNDIKNGDVDYPQLTLNGDTITSWEISSGATNFSELDNDTIVGGSDGKEVIDYLFTNKASSVELDQLENLVNETIETLQGTVIDLAEVVGSTGSSIGTTPTNLLGTINQQFEFTDKNELVNEVDATIIDVKENSTGTLYYSFKLSEDGTNEPTLTIEIFNYDTGTAIKTIGTWTPDFTGGVSVDTGLLATNIKLETGKYGIRAYTSVGSVLISNVVIDIKNTILGSTTSVVKAEDVTTTDDFGGANVLESLNISKALITDLEFSKAEKVNYNQSQVAIKWGGLDSSVSAILSGSGFYYENEDGVQIAHINENGDGKLTILQEPTNDNDAVNKKYVDSVAGFDIQEFYDHQFEIDSLHLFKNDPNTTLPTGVVATWEELTSTEGDALLLGGTGGTLDSGEVKAHSHTVSPVGTNYNGQIGIRSAFENPENAEADGAGKLLEADQYDKTPDILLNIDETGGTRNIAAGIYTGMQLWKRTV